MTRRWLALALSLALLALPFAAVRAVAGVPAAAASCHCDGPPSCETPACPPAAECAPCVRAPVLFAADAPPPAAFDAAALVPATPPAWRDRVIAPAPEPPR